MSDAITSSSTPVLQQILDRAQELLGITDEKFIDEFFGTQRKREVKA
jgi:hypothetical protein